MDRIERRTPGASAIFLSGVNSDVAARARFIFRPALPFSGFVPVPVRLGRREERVFILVMAIPFGDSALWPTEESSTKGRSELVPSWKAAG
jgi:hypothetical protein